MTARTSAIAVVLFNAIALAAFAGAQPPARENVVQQGSGVIRGRVVAADTGAPLPGATVRASGGTPAGPTITSPSGPRAIATDRDGRYEITDLPPGRYTITADHVGYAPQTFGQRRPSDAGRPVQVNNGPTAESVDFRLAPGGVIVVRVLDERGEPLENATARAMQYRYQRGEKVLSAVSGGLLPMTDDRGEMRLAGLHPGDYYVSVGGRIPTQSVGAASNGRSYLTTFYPGTLSEADAHAVTVAAGRETVINVPMAAARLSQITGVIRTSDGAVPVQPSANLGFGRLGGSGFRGMTIRPDGSFQIANVEPGPYTINVAPRLAAATDGEFARFPIEVTGNDISGLVVTTNKGGTIRGRLVFDDGPSGDLRGGSVQLQAGNRVSTGRSTWNEDWTFEMRGLIGTALLRLTGVNTNGVLLKAVLMGDREVTDIPLEFASDADVRDVQVILTRKRSAVSGTVASESGAAVNDYAVVVFGEDASKWGPTNRFVAVGAPDQQGRFDASGLPAGRYLAVALDYLERGAELDADFLRRLRDRATPVTLEEGETKNMTLRLIAF